MRNASKKAKKKIFPDTNFSGRNLLLSIFVVLTIFLNLLLHFYLIRNHAQREVIHSNALVSSINVYLSRLEEASILANTLSFSSSEQTDRALSLIKKLYHASVVFIMDAQGDVIASTPYDAAGTTDFETYFSTHPEEARKLINKGKILDVNLYSQTLYGVNSKEHLLQNTHALFSTQPISSVIHQLATIATEPDDLSGTTIHSTIDGRELQLEYHWIVPRDTKKTGKKSLLSSLISHLRLLCKTNFSVVKNLCASSIKPCVMTSSTTYLSFTAH